MERKAQTKGNSEDSILVIYILRIIKKYSSPDNPLSTQDVMDYLEKDYSIGITDKSEAQKKKVRRHLDTLHECYVNGCVQKIEGKTRKGHDWYYDSSKDKFANEDVKVQVKETLSETEIELLVDLIASTKILNSEGTIGMIDKLLRKTSASEEERTRRLRAFQGEDWFKTANEDLVEKKDIIQECIGFCRIRFDYEDEKSILATPIGWIYDGGICFLNAKVGDKCRKFSLDKIRICDDCVEGDYDFENFARHEKEKDSDKTTLDSLFVNIPIIKSAIADKKCIKFLYRSYGVVNDRVILKDDVKKVLPHSLVFNDGKYYLIGIDEESSNLNKIAYFRVDLMFELYYSETQIKLSDWSQRIFEEINRARVVEMHPFMEAERDELITFKVVESALNRVADDFGIKPDKMREMHVTDETRTVKDSSEKGYHNERIVKVDVRTSKTEAFKWALANADVVEIITQDIRDELARLADPIYRIYTQTVSDKVRENIDYILEKGIFRISNDIDEKLALSTFKELSRRHDTEIVKHIYFQRDDCEPGNYLASFTNTKKLCVHRSPQCTMLPWAANFTKLETLDIWDTSVTDLSWLKDIRGLKRLEIADSPICDLSMLRDHINIVALSLTRTKVNDISFIENYQRLDRLVLVECPIDDYSPLFRLQSRLRGLFIDENTAKKIDLDKLRKQHLGIDIQIEPQIKTWLW